jgi:hypothetical protein
MRSPCEFQALSSNTWGQPVREILCSKKGGVGLGGWWLRDQYQALADPYPAFCPARIIRPWHPPSTWARSRRRNLNERQGQHSTRRKQMMPTRHHLRACARAPDSGRLFASAPPSADFVCDFAIGAARDNVVLRKRAMKPGPPCQRIVLCLALSGANGGLLLYFAFVHIAHSLSTPLSGRARGLYAVSPSGLALRLPLCRCSDLPAASAAGAP